VSSPNFDHAEADRLADVIWGSCLVVVLALVLTFALLFLRAKHGSEDYAALVILVLGWLVALIAAPVAALNSYRLRRHMRLHPKTMTQRNATAVVVGGMIGVSVLAVVFVNFIWSKI
jgi:Kef-type K+ transport system membrane component KefB